MTILKRQRQALLLAAATLALAAALVSLNERWRRDAVLDAERGTQIGGTEVGAPFSLTDQNGQTVADTDFRGRPVVIIFGKTTEHDRLRAALQVSSLALGILQKSKPAGEPGIAALFIALDGADGGRKALSALLADLGYPWRGLTGPVDRITAVARAFLVPGFAKQATARGSPPSGPPGLYLLNADGRFAGHIVVPNDIDRLARWISNKL